MHQQRGPQPRQQDRLLGRVQTHLRYCRQKQPQRKTYHRGPTHGQTHGCKNKQNKRWVNRWNGQETKMRGQRQEKAENTRNMQPSYCSDRSDYATSHIMSFRGLHKAAFSGCTACAGLWNEAGCHKLLVLCDKREDVKFGDEGNQASLWQNCSIGSFEKINPAPHPLDIFMNQLVSH